MRVVIVGGGTVGLCTAVFLARQGVSVHVLERRAKVNDHPRAFGLSDRSAEILREAGIEVETASFGRGLMTGPSLGELTAVTSKFERPEIGSAKLGSCPQDRIDRAAVVLLRDMGSRVDFDSEVVAVGDDSVTTKDGRVVTGDYLIGADGIRSRTRELLGIGVTGPGPLGDSHMLNVLFRAELPAPPLSMTFLRNERASGILYRVDEAGRWIFHIHNAIRTRPPSRSSSGSGTRPASRRPSRRSSARYRGHRLHMWPTRSGGAGSSLSATRHTRCRRSAASDSTRVSLTATTWRGNWPPGARHCSTPMKPSAVRSRCSPWNRA